ELQKIPQIGPETARALKKFSQDKNMKDELKELKKLGLESCFHDPKLAKAQSSGKSLPLEGCTLVITGTLSKPRDEIKKILKNQGAKITDSVSKQTTALIAGEAAGSKLEKAQK